MSFQLLGASALLKAMNDAIESAKRADKEFYWVGSAVPYGPFHEFGTNRMPARPHWTPAIKVTAQQFQLVVGGGDDLVNDMLIAPRGLVRRVAFSLERTVKKMITTLHIIDTGNYRGSIATGPTEQEAFSLSVSQLIE